MDRQNIFNTVVAHARKQGEKALIKIHYDGDKFQPKCVYRTPDGKKCFIGCLIPDELYNPNMEEKAINTNGPNLLPVLNHLEAKETDMGFLSRLQNIHDSRSESAWEIEFERFAGEYNLTIPPLDIPAQPS